MKPKAQRCKHSQCSVFALTLTASNCRATTLTEQNKTGHCKSLLSPQGGRSKQRNVPAPSSLQNIGVSVVFHLIYCYFLALFCTRCLVTFHQTLPQNIPKFEGGEQLSILLKKIDCTTDVWVCVCVWACVSEACAFSHTDARLLLCLNYGHAHSWWRSSRAAYSHMHRVAAGIPAGKRSELHSRTLQNICFYFHFFVLAA